MSLRFAKHSLYSAVAGLATVFASFVSGVVIANLLGVHGTGLVAFAVWLALVIAPVVDGGTALSIGRFLPDLKGRNDTPAAYALPGRLARRLLLFNLLALVLPAIFYLVDADAALGVARRIFGDEPPGISVSLVILVAALVLLQSFAMFATAYFRGSQKFVTLAALTSSSMVAQIACVYVGTRYFGIAGAVAGYVIGQGFLAFATTLLLWRRGIVSPALVRQTRQYGRFSWAANICNTFVWSRIEILFLQSFWGYHEVGLFSVALALSALASQGPLLLTGAFLPMLAEKHGRQDRAGLQAAFERGTRLLAMFAFPACFGMAAILPALVGLLYGHAFEPAVPAAMIIVTAAAFSITTVIGTHLVNALARSDFIFASSLVGAFLSVSIGFLLIPHFGLLGAAISRTVTQLAMIVLGLWFITARLGFAYPFGPLARIVLAALAASLGALLIVTATNGVGGLIAAIVIAALIYTLCLRLFDAAHPEDIALAHRLSGALPSPLAGAANILLSFIHRGPTTGRPATS